jgi:hypothetical protein
MPSDYPGAHALPSNHYEREQCPHCKKKIKVMRFPFRRLAQHALPGKPYEHCPGSRQRV